MRLIKVVFKFIRGIFSVKKREYTLNFKEEDDKWYIDIPWPGKKDNLEMVFGADRLLSYLGKGKVSISVVPSKKDKQLDGYFKLSRLAYKWTNGAFYKVEGIPFKEEIWICPVTLCVLGYYPKYLYIKCLTKQFGSVYT